MFIVVTVIARGVARSFQKGGGSQRLLTRSPSGDRRLYMVYTAAFPRVSAGSVVLSRHEGPRQEPLTKTLYKKKKFGFSTMAFTAKVLSWRFRHLNIFRLFAQKKAYQGGGGGGGGGVTGTSGPPSSYAPDIDFS